jgi:hypothetical protein
LRVAARACVGAGGGGDEGHRRDEAGGWRRWICRGKGKGGRETAGDRNSSRVCCNAAYIGVI